MSRRKWVLSIVAIVVCVTVQPVGRLLIDNYLSAISGVKICSSQASFNFINRSVSLKNVSVADMAVKPVCDSTQSEATNDSSGFTMGDGPVDNAHTGDECLFQADRVWTQFSLADLLYRRIVATNMFIDGARLVPSDRSLKLYPNSVNDLSPQAKQPTKVSLSDRDLSLPALAFKPVSPEPTVRATTASYRLPIQQMHELFLDRQRALQATFDKLREQLERIELAEANVTNPLRLESELVSAQSKLDSIRQTLKNQREEVIRTKKQLKLDRDVVQRCEISDLESLHVQLTSDSTIKPFTEQESIVVAESLLKEILAAETVKFSTFLALSRDVTSATQKLTERTVVLSEEGNWVRKKNRGIDYYFTPADETRSSIAFNQCKLRGEASLSDGKMDVTGIIRQTGIGSAEHPVTKASCELSFTRMNDVDGVKDFSVIARTHPSDRQDTFQAELKRAKPGKFAGVAQRNDWKIQLDGADLSCQLVWSEHDGSWVCETNFELHEMVCSLTSSQTSKTVSVDKVAGEVTRITSKVDGTRSDSLLVAKSSAISSDVVAKVAQRLKELSEIKFNNRLDTAKLEYKRQLEREVKEADDRVKTEWNSFVGQFLDLEKRSDQLVEQLAKANLSRVETRFSRSMQGNATR